jgi:hypothetical protein
VLADRSWRKPARLDEVFMVTSEQIAPPALRKCGFLSALSKHLKKVVQCGAIKPPIMVHF